MKFLVTAALVGAAAAATADSARCVKSPRSISEELLTKFPNSAMN